MAQTPWEERVTPRRSLVEVFAAHVPHLKIAVDVFELWFAHNSVAEAGAPHGVDAMYPHQLEGRGELPDGRGATE
jgi:hypothetical protein